MDTRRKSLCAMAVQDYPVLEYRSMPPEGNASVKAYRHIVSDNPSVVHRHTFIELVYVESGTGIHSMDNSRTALTKGDLCIIHPGSYHKLESHPRDDHEAPASATPFVVVNIIFDTRFAASLLEGIQEEDQILIRENMDKNVRSDRLHGAPDSSLAHIAALLVEETNQNQAYACELAAAYAKALLLLVIRRSRESGASPIEGRDLHTIRQLEDYIRKHPDKDLRLSTLAAEAGTGPRNLERLYKKVRGKTIKDAVREARMQEALNLLRFSTLPIRSISERVGFSDPSHFYHVFKATYGSPPAEYRR